MDDFQIYNVAGQGCVVDRCRQPACMMLNGQFNTCIYDAVEEWGHMHEQLLLTALYSSIKYLLEKLKYLMDQKDDTLRTRVPTCTAALH